LKRVHPAIVAAPGSLLQKSTIRAQSAQIDATPPVIGYRIVEAVIITGSLLSIHRSLGKMKA
jgi:hypothetical protein